MGLGTCTSRWYCPPASLVPTHREMYGHKYAFVQVCTRVGRTCGCMGGVWGGRRGRGREGRARRSIEWIRVVDA